MNEINVLGGTKKKRELVTDIIRFVIDELMPRMKTLYIDVEIKKLDEGICGWCLEGETNRDFEVEIDNKIKGDELIESVCHEMVHVWQSATNRGKYYVNGQKRWLNTIYEADHFTYDEEPWEIEAYEMQNSLRDKFKEVYYVDK
jgi:hypothetical protein